jgi:formylglycine-generating enzyme required for sulfatase activity
VSVGNAGNVPDPATGNQYGSVDYDYHIGKYEVTNRQYTAFLNAVAATDSHGLYNSSMSLDADYGGITQAGSTGSFDYSVKSGFDNKPVNYVSFYDSARFANWLMNGQPSGSQGSGTTEDGFYSFDGTTNIISEASHSSSQVNGINWVAVASEDEWYKAAYYDGNGGYYDYPTESDQAPDPSSPTTNANSANYQKAVDSVTEVGAYPNSGSHYGTFDQGGNVREWNNEIIGSKRGLRGGSFVNGSAALQSSFQFREGVPTSETSKIGFRVTSLAPIPEPSSYGAIFGIVGLATAVFFRRRRRRE